jgi:hypothetical protein
MIVLGMDGPQVVGLVLEAERAFHVALSGGEPRLEIPLERSPVVSPPSRLRKSRRPPTSPEKSWRRP